MVRVSSDVPFDFATLQINSRLQLAYLKWFHGFINKKVELFCVEVSHLWNI